MAQEYTQDEVGYSADRRKIFTKCERCVFYIPPETGFGGVEQGLGSCEQVIGQISPEGDCILWRMFRRPILFDGIGGRKPLLFREGDSFLGKGPKFKKGDVFKTY